MAKTVVEILDNSLDKIAEVRNLYPINQKGDVLRYSKELSDAGECRFRISTKDPILTNDYVKPHAYHVRIKRGKETAWQGVIVDNAQRNRNFVEVVAKQYIWYLSKMLIRRDTEATPGDGLNAFRIFDSGTMGSNVTTLVNNMKTDFGSSHLMSGLTVGTVETPDFPETFAPDYTGAWTFSSTMLLQFDYHPVLYVLQAFGIYSNADFEITDDLVFNFKKVIGTRRYDYSLEYGTRGNIVDYNLPRLGGRMANELVGIAATDDGVILQATQRDSASINEYGLLQEAVAYSDVKNANILKKRLAEQLRFYKNPDSSPMNLVLNENAYPIGQYGIGDVLLVKVKDHSIDYRDWRRIVGMTITVHNTGRETVVIQTNVPREEHLV